MTEIRDPRSVRQSQIRFRPEKASKCAKNTNDRDPRSVLQSQIRFRPEKASKCAKNTNDPFIYGFLLQFFSVLTTF